MIDFRNQILQGDVIDRLQDIPEQSVNCVVTSPPYWGLRDYGVDGQIGLESTPQEFVCRLTAVFEEVRRVLRNDGTLWLNLGDSYAGNGAAYGEVKSTLQGSKQSTRMGAKRMPKRGNGLKAKDLVGIPWRVALALQDAGWWLRSEIIWHKPNPMPSSVKDRPTVAHETLFLLSKSAHYYYDHEAVREAAKSISANHAWPQGWAIDGDHNAIAHNKQSKRRTIRPCDTRGGGQGSGVMTYPFVGRNLRSVWTISTHPFPAAHFATFPPKLVEPCIKAGCPVEVCRECGAPLVRVVEKGLVPTSKAAKTFVVDDRDLHADANDQGSNRQKDGHKPGYIGANKTIGWTPTCECAGETRPGIVLDPFFGSGTTGLVAKHLGRDFAGIELNPEYVTIAKKRLQESVPLLMVG